MEKHTIKNKITRQEHKIQTHSIKIIVRNKFNVDSCAPANVDACVL